MDPALTISRLTYAIGDVHGRDGVLCCLDLLGQSLCFLRRPAQPRTSISEGISPISTNLRKTLQTSA